LGYDLAKHGLMTNYQKASFALRPLHQFQQLFSACQGCQRGADFEFATQCMGSLLCPHSGTDEHFCTCWQLAVKPFGHACGLFFASRGEVSGHVIAHQLQINGFGMTP
jgi:hypothetical protein